MSHSIRRNRRSRMRKFRNFWNTSFTSRGARATRLFEPLEPRMMLHGDTVHDHDPEYDLNDFHIHASLSMYVDGELVQIPANIGIDDSGFLDFVHTHEADNIVHLHNVNGQSPPDFITLDQFFDVWREKGGLAGNNPDSLLSATQLLDNQVDGDGSLRMYVNGIRTMDFENYVIHDGDQIVLSYSSRPIVTLETNFGPIVMELLSDLAPITVTGSPSRPSEKRWTWSRVSSHGIDG